MPAWLKNQGGFFVLRKGRIYVSLLLAVFLLSTAILCHADANSMQSEIVAYYENSERTISDFWKLGALKGAGVDVEDGTWTLDSNMFAPLTSNLPTDYANKILAALTIGRDPRTATGRDIVAELAEKQDENGSFSSASNQHIWAMIALDAAKQDYDKDKALQHLANINIDDGGYNLEGDTSDVDITAMALIALSNHKGNEVADRLIDDAVEFLKDAQLETAGFSNFGSENTNSIATVISGLTAVDINIFSDNWVKSEKTMLDALASFANSDGTYNPTTNEIATVQALIAIDDIIKSKSMWTDFDVPVTVTVSVKVEGISNNILNKSITVSKYAPKAIDAIKKVLKENKVEHSIIDSTYGKYISSINGEIGGAFGGWEGWMFLVNGESPMVGIDSLDINDGDEIILYYGNWDASPLLSIYSVSPSTLRAGSKIYITVSSTHFDLSSMKNVVTKAEGATVKIGGKTYITNENGVATINDIDKKGTYKVEISKQISASTLQKIPEFEIEVLNASSGSRGSSGNITIIAPVVETEEAEAPDVAVKKEYEDKSNISSWALDKVEKAKEYEIMKGTADAIFEPKKALTRGEFVAILVRLLKADALDESESVNYSDIKEDDWFYKYVATAKKLGLVSGFEDNTFRPTDNITREQMATIIARAFSFEDGSVDFNDNGEISDWAKTAVARLASNKIMTGADGKFEPKKNVTREMAAVVSVRLYELRKN